MKATILKLLASLIMVSLCSCSSELEEPPTVENDQPSKNKEIRSIEEALASADNLFSQLSEETRSLKRTVSTVQTITSLKTRANADSEPILYLVNYENNGGFALLGANRNSSDIYAISEKGHLEMRDTLNNPGLALFIRNAQSDAERSSMELQDSHYPYDYVYVIDGKAEPMLHSNVSLWHQKAPFNNYCTLSGTSTHTDDAVVGDAVLAFAGLLSYYEKDAPYPYAYSGKEGNLNIDWSIVKEIDSEAHPKINQLAKYFKILGGSEFLKGSYSSRKTTVNPKNFRSALTKLNFKSTNLFYQTSLKDSVYHVLKFLTNGRGTVKAAPVIMRGLYDEINASGTIKRDYYWIVDGYIMRHRKIDEINPSPLKSIYKIMLHCVWGKEPFAVSEYADGYFLYLQSDDKMDETLLTQDGHEVSNVPVIYKEISVYGGYERNPY